MAQLNQMTTTLKPGDIHPQLAKQLLAIRDELVKGDMDEAFHILYCIASPDMDKFEPWEELEKRAALDLITPPQDGAEQIIAELTGNESHIALIAEASGIAPSNEDLCYQAMGLILNLFPPEEHGEDADVANLFEIVEIIKYRETEQQDGAEQGEAEKGRDMRFDILSKFQRHYCEPSMAGGFYCYKVSDTVEAMSDFAQSQNAALRAEIERLRGEVEELKGQLSELAFAAKNLK